MAFLSRFLIVLTLAAFTGILCAAESSSNQPAPLNRHPFDPNVILSKSYSEIYTLNTLFDDQTFIQTKMILTNIGLGDSNAASEILVLHTGEKPKKISKRFKKSGWSYVGGLNPTLSIGSCSLLQEGETTKCIMAMDNASASFILARPPSSDKSADTFLIDPHSKKFLTDEVLIPWTAVTTVLRLPGQPERQLHGFGMMEHSRSVGYPKDFSRGWISYYGCRQGRRLVANFHFPPCKGTSCAVGWTWASADETSKPLEGLQVAMKSSVPCENESLLPCVSAPHDSFVIAAYQTLYRFSIIDELGPFLGCIVKLIVGNPVTHFYWAKVQDVPGQPPIEGVLEIMAFE